MKTPDIYLKPSGSHRLLPSNPFFLIALLTLLGGLGGYTLAVTWEPWGPDLGSGMAIFFFTPGGAILGLLLASLMLFVRGPRREKE